MLPWFWAVQVSRLRYWPPFLAMAVQRITFSSSTDMLFLTFHISAPVSSSPGCCPWFHSSPPLRLDWVPLCPTDTTCLILSLQLPGCTYGYIICLCVWPLWGLKWNLACLVQFLEHRKWLIHWMICTILNMPCFGYWYMYICLDTCKCTHQ